MICVLFHYITRWATRSVSASSRPDQKEPRRKAWQFLNSPQKNRWSALRAASEKAARSGDRFRFSSDLVRFYAQVRTSFETKAK